jgi:hypothetical protein
MAALQSNGRFQKRCATRQLPLDPIIAQSPKAPYSNDNRTALHGDPPGDLANAQAIYGCYAHAQVKEFALLAYKRGPSPEVP